MDGSNRDHFSSLSVLISNTITVVAVFACLIVNEFWRKGFVRSVFRLKAITSIIAMLLMITKEVLALYFDPKIPRIRKAVGTAMKHLTIVEHIFSQWDQVCSLVFLYEMYLCTCKMEARENSPLQLHKKVLTAWIVPLLGNLYELIPQLLFTGKNFWLVEIMLILFKAIFHTFSVIASLYLGILTAKALIKSYLFHRKQVAQPGTGRVNHLFPILLVITISFVQCIRFAFIVSRIAIIFRSIGTTKECLESAILPLIPKEVVECLLGFANTVHSKVYFFKSTGWLSIFEMASLVMPMLVSRACDCRARP